MNIEQNKKIIVTYDAIHGVAIADGLVNSFVDELIKNKEQKKITTSSSLVIDFLRLAVVKKQILHTDLIFIFKGKEMKVNENGRLNHYPEGFCDHSVNVLMELF